jgi:DMSO reductase anchor subunit
MAMDFTLICAAVALFFVMVIGVVLFFKLAKIAIKWLATLILNSVVGIVLLFLLNMVLSYLSMMTIPYSLPVLLSIALFGIPGLATILILKYFGVTTF